MLQLNRRVRCTLPTPNHRFRSFPRGRFQNVGYLGGKRNAFAAAAVEGRGCCVDRAITVVVFDRIGFITSGSWKGTEKG